MDIAIVTGASGGVGLAVARKLVELGYRVYGLGGNYQDLSFTHADFRGIPCDLTNPSDLVEKADQILREEGNISILVNNAKFFTFKPFEETQPSDFDTTLTINLLCPLILARVALPSLARLGGHIINIAPHSVDQSRGGPAAAAAAGGLDWLGESLFEELRDFGVRVSTLYPQANRTKAEGPTPGAKNPPRAQINVDAIAEAIEAILSAKHGNFFSRVVLRPERSREQPIPAILRVPMPKALEDYPRIKEPPTEEELSENANRRHRDREKNREEDRKRRRSEEERIYRERLAGNAQLARDERDDPDAAPLPPRDPELDGEDYENEDEGDDHSGEPDRVNLDERAPAEPERRPHRDGRNERRERQPQPQQQQPREPRPPREPRQRQGQQQRPPQAQPPIEGAPVPPPTDGAEPTETPSHQTVEPQNDQPATEGQPASVEEVKPAKPDLQAMIREQIRLRKEREAAAAGETKAETEEAKKGESEEAAQPVTPANDTSSALSASPEAPPLAPKKTDLREILREKMRQKRAAEAAEAQAATETETETKTETEEVKMRRGEEETKALPSTNVPSSPPHLLTSSASLASATSATSSGSRFAPGGTGGSFRPASGLGPAVKSSLGGLQNRLRRGSVRAALAPTPATPTPAQVEGAPPVEIQVESPAPVSHVESIPESPASETGQTEMALEIPADANEADDSSAPRRTPRKAAPRKAAKKQPRKAADTAEDATEEV